MGLDNFAIINNEQKQYALNLFLQEHSSFEPIDRDLIAEIGNTPVYSLENGTYHLLKSIDPARAKRETLYRKVDHYELQDIYKWLYYGEFGPEEQVGYLKRDSTKSELENLLQNIKDERDNPNLSPHLWRPMGLSIRFIKINVSQYRKSELPLKTLEDLINRSPAFRGTRVHFKLDWSFIKEFLISKAKRYTKEDFYNFEDKFNFHQLPTVDFTPTYLKKFPDNYRIVPRKLFFDFFPEFDSKYDIWDKRPGDSLLD